MLVADLKRLLPPHRHQLVDSLEAEARASWNDQVREQAAALSRKPPPPGILIDARQDRPHIPATNARLSKAFRASRAV